MSSKVDPELEERLRTLPARMKKMLNTFHYSDAPQRSPEWIELRAGKITASRLKDWMAVSKRDGKPLQARKDYEAELLFEIEFDVPFTRFVTGAMEEGQAMEEFVKRQYEQIEDVIVRPTGCYYNEYFVASPDGEIGDDGLIEIKWVYDKTFSDVLANGVPEAHMLQMQGQLWASGRKWCDYVVGNGNSQHFTIIRVERDEAIIDSIRESLMDVRFKSERPGRMNDRIFPFSETPQIDNPNPISEEF